MRKIFLVVIFSIVIVVFCIVGFFWLMQESGGLDAQLVINSGTVLVKHGGDSWDVATSGMLLYSSDSVRTGDNSSASIVFFKSSIVRLDSNTEVMIKELMRAAEITNVTLDQSVGRTWNTIRNISGIDNYEVQTPTTVASVRATTFVITVGIDGETFGGVGQGIVNVSKVIEGEVIDKIDVKRDEAVTVSPLIIDKPLRVVVFEKDEWVVENERKDNESIWDIKVELYRRIEPYIPELKERYGVTDDELDVLLDGYLLGYYDLPPETPDWIREIIELS
jgi:hypothetical protein